MAADGGNDEVGRTEIDRVLSGRSDTRGCYRTPTGGVGMDVGLCFLWGDMSQENPSRTMEWQASRSTANRILPTFRIHYPLTRQGHSEIGTN